jgi:hypothetical protein
MANTVESNLVHQRDYTGKTLGQYRTESNCRFLMLGLATYVAGSGI